jgi:glycosyltransferase involved in cell wall biosynthesis
VQTVAARADRPFRLGLWCVWESPEATASILPNDGIGVFVYNLIGGLLAQENPPEVVLVVRPSEHHRVASFLKAPRPHLTILPPPPPRVPFWKDPAGLLRRVAERAERARVRVQQLRIDDLPRRARNRVKHALRPAAQAAVRHKGLLSLLALALPFLFLIAWGLYAVYRLGLAVLRILAAPLVWGHQCLRYLAKHRNLALKKATAADAAALADEAACDMWVVPSLHCNSPRNLPSVLFIHDLVTSHFPEIFDQDFVDRVNRIAPGRAADATLVACMSAFIRDTDLLGVLKLPPEKVRMVPSATPVDFPVLTEAEVRALKPTSLKRPYLFFPTAFRPYKNHRGLIKALRRLRDTHANNEFDLVFTGDDLRWIPDDLHRLIDKYSLRNRVHVLGRIDRRTLAAVYRSAYAVIVPSLYEQGSFQIVEALHFNIPVACARIPAFVEQCAPLGDAMIYFDPENPADIAEAILTIRNRRDVIREQQRVASQALWKRTWKQVAAEWLPVFREAATLAGTLREEEQAADSPTGPVLAADSEKPEVFLFLHTAYLGGVWEATKNLVIKLVEINRRRRQLGLVLGVNPAQADTSGLRRLAPDLRLEKLHLEELTLSEARNLLGAGFTYPDDRQRERFCIYHGETYPALRADAWFALLDRFPLPLLPARPYGVWVYDMLQRYVPEQFGEEFFTQVVQGGMRPTLRNAHVIVTTSPATQQDVMDEYAIGLDQLMLIPSACEPHQRFGPLLAEPVPLPREPFLLYPSNASPHKGALVVLRAYARLIERLGDKAPLLVQCGTNSNVFSSRYRLQPTDSPHWEAVQLLVHELELEEGRDVVFLGFVNDRQLLDLYERCRAVICAAKYDNGSYAMVEGRYFGRPLISTEYPAAVNLCERFQLPARFFPRDDDAALAQLMHQAMREPRLTGPALEAVRRQLADSEYSLQRHAERVYDVLVQLARTGRHQRLGRLGESVVPFSEHAGHWRQDQPDGSVAARPLGRHGERVADSSR